MTCPKCQTENSPEAKFCINCGQALNKETPSIQPTPLPQQNEQTSSNLKEDFSQTSLFNKEKLTKIGVSITLLFFVAIITAKILPIPLKKDIGIGFFLIAIFSLLICAFFALSALSVVNNIQHKLKDMKVGKERSILSFKLCFQQRSYRITLFSAVVSVIFMLLGYLFLTIK